MPRLHEDPDRFAEALSFTEAETTFPARLLEKDYYCTVLLQYLSGRVPRLVFKGGTCLAKVHANFFRLSTHGTKYEDVLLLPFRRQFARLPSLI